MTIKASTSSKRVIYAALAGNLAIAVIKFAAAAWTGSSAMLSEGVHSLVDTGNQSLMLYGIRRAAKPADPQHPLGHGRELYFWTFIVALLIFSLGAGASFYEGVTHIAAPVVIEDPKVNYIVLAVAFVFEGLTWRVAWREFNKTRGQQGLLDAVKRSRDPTSFVVLFEDSAALVGIVIALIGTITAVWLDAPVFDGVASILIGVVLAATAVFLVRESKGLLLGEPALMATRNSIMTIAETHPNVNAIGRLVTVHLSPHEIVVALDVDFSEDLRASGVEATAGEIEQQIRAMHPDVTALFLNPRVRPGITYQNTRNDEFSSQK